MARLYNNYKEVYSKMQKIFAIFILLTLTYSSNNYYFNGNKKVFINHKKNISRSLDACEIYIENDKSICLYNQIIVKTKNIDKIIKEYNLKYDKHLFNDVHLVSVKKQKDTLKIANLLYENKKVIYAYPNFERTNQYRLDLDLKDPLRNPRFKDAWYLKNTGQEQYYKIGSDIKILDAWKIATGRGSVGGFAPIKIGILDDGIETDHADVQFLGGYSIKDPTEGDPAHYETNTDHHGTKIATLIAGLHNDIGSIGVAPNAGLVVVNIDRNSKTSDIIDAFKYMLKKKVDIISNSWGTYDVPAPVVDIINKVANEGRKDKKTGVAKGTIIIFSSGNDNKDLDNPDINDESELPSVIGVGGTTPYDSRYHLSDYGSNIDLVAPAESLYVGHNNDYILDSGTSFAAPIVAGVVALMLEVNKDLTRQEVKEILTKTADKIGTNVYDKNGFNRYYGYGRIDAASAVREAKLKNKEADETGDEVFLSIDKGWNLISIPVKKTLHYEDFYKYFDKDSDIVSFREQGYNFYVKSIFPGQSFWLYSIRKYDVPFIGNEFNLTRSEYNLNLGWNMIGVGEDSNTTKLKEQLVAKILHVYDTKNVKWDFYPKVLKRGQGAFLYKDEF
jgi:hypothetical protein